jgi:hypothetical protein
MRRLVVSISMVVVILGSAPTVAASGPLDVGVASGDKPEVLTPAEQEILALKSAEAAAIVLDMRAIAAGEGGKLITPDVFCEGEPPCLPSGAPSTRVLGAYARQQNNCAYCGPASGQVAINSSRGYAYTDTNGQSTSHNYKTQSVIASAMGTSLSTGTTVSGVKNGLNQYAQLPSGFIYAYTSVGNATTQPSLGDQAEYLYSLLIDDVYRYSMIQVLHVRPHAPGATYWLSSWPLEVSSTSGHYIALNGYKNFWSDANPSQAIAYYADSATGCAGNNVGVTGKWSDPILKLKYTNSRSSGYAIW